MASARLFDDLPGKPHERARTGRRGVADRVGDTDPRRAGPDGCGEQPADRLGIRACGVLGDVHHLEAAPDRKPDGLVRAALQVIDGPVLRVLPYGARPDEAAALDRQPRPLLNVHDRLDVRHDRAGRAVGRDPQLRLDDFTRQPLRVSDHVGAGTREPDVRGIDAEVVEQVQDPQLLLDGRRPH